MPQSIGEGSHHLDRLHYHRERVNAAHAALDDAARATVRRHYDPSQAPGAVSADELPTGTTQDQTPAPS